MAMRTKRSKPAVCIFCEGEGSEKAYSQFLRNEFSDVVRIAKIEVGLFDEARAKLASDQWYQNNIDVINEFWFFFDVDKDTRYNGTAESWSQVIQPFLSQLGRHRNTKNLKVRFLMTTGCIEYWFLLHYKRVHPSIATKQEKVRVLNELKKECPEYTKAGKDVIRAIAETHIQTALENGTWSIHQIRRTGLPEGGASRYQWLYTCDETFTNVQDAVNCLKQLSDQKKN